MNEEKWDALLLKLKVGDKVKAIVSKIASFGVFCEVDGVTGLLRQRDISYKNTLLLNNTFRSVKK